MANDLSYGNSPGINTNVTITLDAGIVAGRGIKYDGSNYAGANDDCAGISLFAASDNYQTVCQNSGVVLVEAGAAISTQYDLVEFDSTGRVVSKTSGIARGKNIDTASAAGDFIRVILTPGA